MIGLREMDLERRIFWIGAWLVAAGSLLAWILFGWRNGVSFLAGGIACRRQPGHVASRGECGDSQRPEEL